MPAECPANYARLCDDGSPCADGSSCLDGLCSGLNITADNCAGECNPAFNAASCESFFVAGYRGVGEVGCSSGSTCAKFHAIVANINALYVLNLIDTILEIVALIFGFCFMFYQLADNGTYQESSIVMITFFLPIDLILQIAVLALAMDGVFMSDINAITDASCWTGYKSFLTWNSVAEDLMLIRVLGWLELCSGVVSILATIYERSGKRDSTMSMFGLLLAFVMMAVDVILSVVDFFAFTLPTKNEMDSFFDSLSTNDAANCIFYNETVNPTMITAKDNCLPAVNDVGMLGSTGWFIWVAVLGSIWGCCGIVGLCLALTGKGPLVREG